VFEGVPIVTIADITREKLRLVVNAFWVNDSKMAAYVKNWSGTNSISCGAAGGVDSTDENY
jgi:hypothetical protein